jgi:hypothetical protein
LPNLRIKFLTVITVTSPLPPASFACNKYLRSHLQICFVTCPS